MRVCEISGTYILLSSVPIMDDVIWVLRKKTGTFQTLVSPVFPAKWTSSMAICQILPDSFASAGQGISDCMFSVQDHLCPLLVGEFTNN